MIDLASPRSAMSFTGNRHLLVLGRAEDEQAVGLADLDAEVDLVLVRDDADGVVAFLHRLVRDEQRFDEVIGLGARADRGHVRADLPARAAVGVAGECIAVPCGGRSVRRGPHRP